MLGIVRLLRRCRSARRTRINFYPCTVLTVMTFDVPAPTAGLGKKRKKEQIADDGGGGKRIKPPTAEELNKLRETENLFLSNMFRLQIDEMLKEVKPKQTTLDKVKEWFDEFSTLLLDVDTSNYKKVSLDDKLFFYDGH